MYFELLRPFSVMFFSFRILPACVPVCLCICALGLYSSCWVAPSDFQQGENARIMSIHVPAAWTSLIIYGSMTLTSILFLLTKHPLFHLLTQTGCQCGALFTFLTLVTGCLWGKPMWGTFWVWDARLTSVLILFLIYLGVMRLNRISAEIASLFVCLGFLNIPIIKFSVNWWNTLHQASSISQFGTSIHISMLIPICVLFLCFMCFCVSIFLLETRRSILYHYTDSLLKRH